MNKKEFSKKVADAMDCTIAEAEEMIDEVFEAVADVLEEGDKIIIRDFGTFSTKVQAARVARNPKTGEKIQVPEKIVPKFKAAVGLKERCN
jgi:nucleoid DNA-binding protein